MAGRPSLGLALLTLLLGTRSDPVSALIGGEPDSQARFGSTVALKIAPDRRCTATKIGPRGFLTAAHCVVDIPTGALTPAARPGGRIALSNLAEPAADSDYRTLRVAETRVADAFASALGRLHAYQESRIADFRARYAGEDLTRRVRRIYAESNLGPRFPDLAIVRVADDTPEIPAAPVDLRALARATDVILVGYGCERVSDLAAGRRGTAPLRRTWGRSQVIRVDAVNFYTFAGDLRPGTPALCPGDSGGPVLANGRVVGVHGTVYGLSPRDTARSNMSVNLNPLAGWDAWPQTEAQVKSKARSSSNNP
jgi:hypothetical protein